MNRAKRKSFPKWAIVFYFLLWGIMMPSLQGQTEWTLQKDEEKIKVWTMNYPSSNFKQFRAETILETNLENVVAVFLDIENMGKWYDRVEKVELVEKISDMEGTYKIDFELPWPVADRVSAVRAILSYDPSANVVKVNTKYEPGILTETSSILITKIHSEWILTPMADGTVKIFHQGFMDPEGSLPAWIANSGVKEGPIKTLTSLRHILPDYKDVNVDFLK